jgi:hypothetical protein
MPAGTNAKREGEYRKLERQFKKEHRYPGREEEVAARIVNKQRAQYGETRQERDKDRQGKSPDRGLPIRDYQHLTIAQITPRLDRLSMAELKTIRAHEAGHKNRKGMLAQIDRSLQNRKRH